MEFPQADLDDLRDRLERTRYAPAAPGDSWDYGTPKSYLRDMVERWKAFDWRAVEARINAHPNYLTEIDGQTIHFLHVRSEVPDARPLLLAHTYPGSVLDFLPLDRPLHGGRRGASTSWFRRCRASASPRPSSTAAGRWRGWPARTTR